MAGVVDADYLVVGAGATGLAFADALVDHSDARVALVDRRHGPGGHWLEAYPFVRLHQASAFYGVASTLLGGGRRQVCGPEAGLHERATQPEIVGYYAAVLDRLVRTGRVEVHLGWSYDGTGLVSCVSGRRLEVAPGCRVVDAHHLAPTIPAEVPPPFAVGDGARVVPVNDLARLQEAPGHHVVVGAGKTATDACVWLLEHGVEPDEITWVRPREPWMFNRAKVQPDPSVFLGMAADVMECAAEADSLDRLFLGLEERGVMLRIDPGLTPTMAKTPTLATWELDRLRTIERVVRHGHVVAVEPGRLDLEDGTSVRVPADALVVHCAADGLRQAPLVPVWGPEAITLQPIRAGFPCFGAALVGYVEATRDDDEVKNRLCPPSGFGNSLADWAAMTGEGTRAVLSFGAEPDIREWADTVPLNPARVPAGHPSSPALDDARERLATHTGPALARLAALAAR